MFYLRGINGMIHKVEKFIAKHALITNRGKVLVALSGGADSVALLIALRKLGYSCEAVHCNFHLRGEESNRDEQFVKELCERLDTKLHITHFNTAEYARRQAVSIEMAARELRYRAFEELRAKSGAEAIAVAHHRDDSAETLLLNLIRGTGIRGLHGIQPRNGYIVRPLLCVSRAEILDYLKWRGESFVTDSTNLTSDYTRNKIRLEVIPKLSEINSSILESLAATATRISEAEKLYSKAVEEAIERVKRDNIIDIGLLQKEVSPATILFEILSPLGFNSTQVANIYESTASEGTRKVQGAEWAVIKERDRLVIAPNNEVCSFKECTATEGTTETPYGTLHITKKMFDGNIPREKHFACIDALKVKLPLKVRSTVAGDRFTPFGMRGSKLVSDYLTDRKRSILEKQRQLVVTDATGSIVWLVGERPAAQFCIGKKTKECIVLLWDKK